MSSLPFACLTVVGARVPDGRAALCSATKQLVEELHLKRARLGWIGKRSGRRAYRAPTLVDVLQDPDTRVISVADDDRHCLISLDLGSTSEQGAYRRRWQTVVAEPAAVAGMLKYAEAIAREVGLVSGGLSGHRHHQDAEVEGTGTLMSGVSAETEQRIGEDAMLSHRAQTRLRRLYPITIIGPALWAELPPMPRFDPMPTIEDFGDAKLMRAWPTLCEPRDPAFLRANRELRAWLWPYTIQNPADHVDQDPA